MKTTKELLKIYSAYLPYELNILTPIWSVDRQENTIQELHSVTKNDLRIQVEKDGFFNCWFETCKPLLYSMDMLTKEIEHKGERFIPCDKLALSRIDCKLTFESDDSLLYGNIIKISKLSYEIVQKLLEWHFNVFGLDESEYIKKENL